MYCVHNNTTDEIHCVKCLAIDETPDLIDKSLYELQIEIDTKIPEYEKTAYIQSQNTEAGRAFVNSKEFRLRFLRCELFDIQKSAFRMIKWLELAYSFFGSVALERPIRLSDFSSAEQKIFRKGYLQVLPVRGTGTGRQIICAIPYDAGFYTNKQVFFKILMYTVWVIGNDIDTQRKGLINFIMFDSSFHQNPNIMGAGIMDSSTVLLLSVRISAFHVCTPDTPFYRLRRSFLTMVIGSHNRSRLKLHIGTPVELTYKLQNYGIPIEFIPITYTGKIKFIYMKQWLRLRSMIEDQEKLTTATANYNTNSIIVEAPYQNDILFKQGDSFTSHPGNNMLRNLIESKVKQLYEMENSKSSKNKELVLEIMDEMQHKYDSRFLYWHQCSHMPYCWWVLLHPDGITSDQKVVFNKIEPIFRRQYSKKQQQQEVIRTKYMNKQQELILHQNNMATDAQNNSNNDEKKRKVIECNSNDTRKRSLIVIDPPATTINQNGGTFLFHSLDGKHDNRHKTHGVDSGNDSDGGTTSMSSSCIPSECFGMNFVPCAD